MPPTEQAYASDVAVPSVLDVPRAFHLLAKPTGAVCNLDCSYCFFLSKEMLYPGSRFRMADELLEAYVEQLIEAHERPASNSVSFKRATALTSSVLCPMTSPTCVDTTTIAPRSRRPLPASRRPGS